MGNRSTRIARQRSQGARAARVGGIFLLWLSLLPAPSSLAEAPDLKWLEGDPGQVLHVEGMTFVASEESENELVLHAARARFFPDHQVADLEDVHVTVAPGPDRTGFEMRCESGRLNLATQSFVAQGRVGGTIEGGRRFEARWVAYDDEDRVLYTNEPVLISDRAGSYRGGGFRYFVDERRFRLEGGASIVQEP